MQKLDATIKIRISSAQHERWRREARQLGCSVSELVRGALLGKAVLRPPEINVDAWSSLSTTAANLNQLARTLNAAALAGAGPLAMAARDHATAALAELQRFRQQLVGMAAEQEEE